MLINITGGRDLNIQEVNEALTLAHDAADPECNIIFGSLIDENAKDEVKITIIATGFSPAATQTRRPSVTGERPIQVQVPLSYRSTPAPTIAPQPAVTVTAPAPIAQPVATLVPAHREELATLVPAKAGSRTLSAEHKLQSPRIAHSRDASLPLDEDQFDIPTFLRRQGHTEMP